MKKVGGYLNDKTGIYSIKLIHSFKKSNRILHRYKVLNAFKITFPRDIYRTETTFHENSPFLKASSHSDYRIKNETYSTNDTDSITQDIITVEGEK